MLLPFEGNCTTSVVRQGKYRITHEGRIEVIIETPDGIRCYPATDSHATLVAMVNHVKDQAHGTGGGQFYINEWRQVIVPAGNPTKYFYAGVYEHDIVLKIDGTEFSGRPHDEKGFPLKPGDLWTGRPRPGIEYKLKAGGADIEYTIALGPQMEKVVKLSKCVGPEGARRTARKIAAIKGNPGGRFYVNEYRAIFGPCTDDDGYRYAFIGTLTETDPWFPRWNPPISPSQTPPPVSPSAPVPASPTPVAPPAAKVSPSPAPVEFTPEAKRLDILDGAIGYSYDSLFAAYLKGAAKVTVTDPYMVRQHQTGNFLRFCELCVRLGTVRQLVLVTREVTDESIATLENIRRSLGSFNLELVVQRSTPQHDRHIRTDHGWEMNLGRGLDIYKRPDDWASVGVSDFSLRPCHQTTIIFHRLPASEQACG